MIGRLPSLTDFDNIYIWRGETVVRPLEACNFLFSTKVENGASKTSVRWCDAL